MDRQKESSATRTLANEAVSLSMLEAAARARPRLHCFGHVHNGWAAKLVSWRDSTSDTLSHLTDIDYGKSAVIETMTGVRPGHV